MQIEHEMIEFTSKSYYLAYKSLIRSHFELLNHYKDKKGISVYFFPAITLCAFSCEIALKNLIFNEQENTFRTHDLDNLFRKLSDFNQMKYKEECLELMKIKSNYYNIDDTYDFDYLLKTNSLVFEESRYLYESKKGADLDFLEAFMFTLNHECDDYYNFITTYKYEND